MLAWVCTGTLLTFAPAAQSADAATNEPRLTLVIGNSAYKIDPLKNPALFLCLNPECWLSYNAALHAIEAGYTNVHWFRGGTDAWRGAGYRTQTVSTSGW